MSTLQLITAVVYCGHNIIGRISAKLSALLLPSMVSTSVQAEKYPQPYQTAPNFLIAWDDLLLRMEPAFIDRVTQRIHELGLATPAILLLEAHKPLAFIGSQLVLVAQPILDIFLPPNLMRNTADLLADPDQMDQLIAGLESTVTPPSTPDTAAE